MKTSNLNTRIAAIGKTTANWREAVQAIATDCCAATFETRSNNEPCSRLIHALGAGGDIATLIAWIEAHALVRWDGKATFKITRKGGAVETFSGAFVANKAHPLHGSDFDKPAVLADKWFIKAQKPAQVKSVFDVSACADKVEAYISKMIKEAKAAVETRDDAADAMVAVLENTRRDFRAELNKEFDVAAVEA